jgi:hypothetical protein
MIGMKKKENIMQLQPLKYEQPRPFMGDVPAQC